MNGAGDVGERLDYLAGLAWLDADVGVRYVRAIHDEDLTVLEHLALIAKGDLPVPPADMQRLAWADVVVGCVYDYLALTEGYRPGASDGVRRELQAAVERYKDGEDAGFRAAVGEGLELPDLAVEFVGAFSDAAAAVRDGEAAARTASERAQAAYVAMREYVAKRAMLAA